MASELLPAQTAQYSAIIDDILAHSDLNTVSAKRIRKGLQDRLEHDITPQKQAITDLIMLRFDRFNQDRANTAPAVEHRPPPPPPGPTTTTNGTHLPVKADPEPLSPVKRKATTSSPDEASDDDLSDVIDTPPRKKAKKVKSTTETDEEIAKRMQAELNAQSARSTRGGGTKRRPVVKSKKATPKKKSKAKINSDDDSDVNSSESKPERAKTGGFHKQMTLSTPLAALVDAPALSRPQTVKRIWAYVKERDLQDPNDKRQIRCDDAMRAVFKQDKVHMFTMNKLLAQHLYAQDE